LDLQRQHTLLHDLKDKARGAAVAVTAKQRQVAQQKAKLDEALQARKKVQMEADAKELEIKGLQGKIEKYRNQLNEVKTNKEYKAIQNEVQFAGIELRRLEDQELATMDKLEQLSGTVQKAQDALAAIEKDLESVKAQVAAKASSLEADIQKAERDRKLIAEQIPSDALIAFDRVAAKLGDSVMAPAIRDDERAGSYSCGGCYMQLTQNDYVKLLGDRNTLVMCPSCSRILFVEPE
jgi:predicted  nucleic acid-binding Zn-ribbon protein